VTLPPSLIVPIEHAADFFLGHPVLCALLFLFAILLLFHWMRRIISVAIAVVVVGMAVIVGWKFMQKEGVKTPKVLQEIKSAASPDTLRVK
jgi:phosphatidylserine synthase